MIDFGTILSTVIGTGPVATLLFVWVWLERKERRQLQDKLITTLESTAGLAESTRDELKRVGALALQGRGEMPRSYSPAPLAPTRG